MTPQERTAWILQRERELQAEAHISTRQQRDSRVKLFSHVADHPDVVRAGGDK